MDAGGIHGHPQEAPWRGGVQQHDLCRGWSGRHHGTQQRRAVQLADQLLAAGSRDDIEEKWGQSLSEVSLSFSFFLFSLQMGMGWGVYIYTYICVCENTSVYGLERGGWSERVCGR